MLYLAVQGLIYPKLNVVLSDLWRYYEWKKVTILIREKNNKNKVSVYVYYDCFAHTQAYFPFKVCFLKICLLNVC